MAEIELSFEYIQSAARHPGVAAQLAVVANRIKTRAEKIAQNEGVDMKVSTETGVRPKGRPYVNVIGDNADQEFGSSRTGRRRILGRAGEPG